MNLISRVDSFNLGSAVWITRFFNILVLISGLLGVLGRSVSDYVSDAAIFINSLME